MLDTTTTTSIATPVARRVTGLYLARNRLDPAKRARLAANILDRHVEVVDLTRTQVAALARVSPRHIKRRPKAKRSPVETIARAWDSMGAAARVELVNRIGTEQVFAAIAEAIG
jgi:hypothetical protein